ncbi:uncharacterized protein A4U43_C05F35590 [Asparagus officinalis]|uniref:Cation transporter HKT7 n=1 Tax=Asparagus officinalis TaxID=4686 RepID=A0A5P1EX04_ASPOF|nr:uncharacterized protein A4U43_C05F35590 [Asparagus officinalis]
MMASRKEEFDEVLITSRGDHEPNFLVMSGPESVMLGATVGGLILVQALLFCCMEWGSPGLDGRRYLPAHTTFLPVEKIGKGIKKDAGDEEGKEEESFVEKLIFSQLSYLSIFTIIICITERRQMSRDPLNFNVLNIVFEVISAYGNVGFSTGYSCKRRLQAEDQRLCRDSAVGFSGKWTRKGKLVLIGVMIFGRLKKFNLNGGKAWMIR